MARLLRCSRQRLCCHSCQCRDRLLLLSRRALDGLEIGLGRLGIGLEELVARGFPLRRNVIALLHGLLLATLHFIALFLQRCAPLVLPAFAVRAFYARVRLQIRFVFDCARAANVNT